MPANIISLLRNTSGDVKVGRRRRMKSSVKNYFSAKSQDFSLKSREGVGTVFDDADNLYGIATGIGSGLDALSEYSKFSAIGQVVAIAGTCAALAGPQCTIVGGVVTLLALGKAVITNREAAHIKLAPYVWSILDDEKPLNSEFTKKSLEEAACAATKLMDNGSAQISLLPGKYAAAEQKMHALDKRILEMHEFIKRVDRLKRMPMHKNNHAAIDRRMKEFKDEQAGLWDKETRSDGIIFNYVRRCTHLANYIQAPHIIALSMLEKLSPNSVIGQKRTDYFANADIALKTRKYTTLNQTLYIDHDVY